MYITFSWSMLTISTNGSYDDGLQAEAAGMAEGFITADQIMMYFNATAAGYCKDDSDFCDKLNTYIENNEKWIDSNIKSGKNDPYWNQASRNFC